MGDNDKKVSRWLLPPETFDNLEFCITVIDRLVEQIEASFEAEEEKGKLDEEAFIVQLHAWEYMAKPNLRAVFHHSESPIERMFLGQLVIGIHVVTRDPFAITVMPPQNEPIVDVQDIIRWKIKKVDEIKAALRQLADALEVSLAEVERQVFGNFPWYQDYMRYSILYSDEFMANSVHLSMQPRFKDILPNQIIRSDALLWIPGDESKKLVLECDGYDYHKDKGRFVADRQRDRGFKKKGYEVLRFSGTEIYHNPLDCAIELLEHLKGEDWLPKYLGEQL